MLSVEERNFEEYYIGRGGPPLVQILGPGIVLCEIRTSWDYIANFY